jgi:hypothetical protein
VSTGKTNPLRFPWLSSAVDKEILPNAQPDALCGELPQRPGRIRCCVRTQCGRVKVLGPSCGGIWVSKEVATCRCVVECARGLAFGERSEIRWREILWKGVREDNVRTDVKVFCFLNFLCMENVFMYHRNKNKSRWGEIFLTRPDRPWGPPNLLYNGYRVFPDGKATGAWC